MSLGELVLVLAVALLALGPGKLPEAGEIAGKLLRNFRRGVREAQDALHGEDVREAAPRHPHSPRLID